MNSFNIRFTVFVLLASAILLSYVYGNWNFVVANNTQDSPVMLLSNNRGGTSSAVHIGNGYIITSNHGISNDHTATITTESGVEISAVHLWSAERYDIALFRAQGNLDVGTYALDCSPLQLHDRLYFIGNPMLLRDITLVGSVAGNALYNVTGIWKHLVPVQAPIVPGMSGGAAIDDRGNLRGINIGTMIHNQGFAYSYTGISYIVPSDAICMLLNK
jgi:serine protease Do